MAAGQPVNDPYWELERYLELAQEEIGRAFDDLKECENSSDGKKFLGSRRTKHDIINEDEGTVFRNKLSIPDIRRVDEHPKIGQKLSCPSNFEYKNFRSEFYSCVSDSKYNLSLDENLEIHSDDDDDVFYSDNEDGASEHIPVDNGHQRFASYPNNDLLTRSTKKRKEIISCPLKCESFDLLSVWANNLLREIDETFSTNNHDETNAVFSSPLETFENESELHSQKTDNVCENGYLCNKLHLTKSCCSTQNNEMCKFSVKYNFRNKCLEKPKVTRHCSYSADMEQSDFQKLRSSDLSPRRSSCPSWKTVGEKITFMKDLIPTAQMVKRTCETAVQNSDVDFFVQRKTGGESVQSKHSPVRSRSEIGVQTSLVTDVANESEAIINRSFKPVEKNINLKLDSSVHPSFGPTKMVITEQGTVAFPPLEDHKRISISANKITDGVEELVEAPASSFENHLLAESDCMEEELDKERHASTTDEKNNQIVEVDEFEKTNRNQHGSVYFMRKMENCAYQPRPPQRGKLDSDAEQPAEKEVPSGHDFVSEDTNTQTTTRSYRSFTWVNENISNKCEELSQTLEGSSLSKESLPSFSSTSISEVLSDVSGSSPAKSTDVHSDDEPELNPNYFRLDDIDDSSNSSLSLSEYSVPSEHGSDSLLHRTEEPDPLSDNLDPTIQHSSELPDSVKKDEIGVPDSIERTRKKSQMSNAKPNNSCIRPQKNYSCSENQLNTISGLGDIDGENVLEAHSNLSLPETSKLFKLYKNNSDKSSSVCVQTLPLPVQKIRNNGHQSVRLISPVKRKISKGNKNEQATRSSTRAKLFLRKMNIKSSSAPLLRLQHNLVENGVRLAQSTVAPDDVNCLRKMTVEENKSIDVTVKANWDYRTTDCGYVLYRTEEL
ncbi:uncharacterized protein LOC106467111 isoform X2 [Limulus polyphemus]|uniref:Uncharacterized protein LOC106467111 isoform X2 n=1 Tax=Limulus polyphemus TaxID=6850 RepID=A0ABM1T4Y6_LIMPO|nr:uncharacterized protein LOC106467111 isoform X2 [Limulus polyphemus]